MNNTTILSRNNSCIKAIYAFLIIRSTVGMWIPMEIPMGMGMGWIWG